MQDYSHVDPSNDIHVHVGIRHLKVTRNHINFQYFTLKHCFHAFCITEKPKGGQSGTGPRGPDTDPSDRATGPPNRPVDGQGGSGDPIRNQHGGETNYVHV